jgi:hypothetical protein
VADNYIPFYNFRQELNRTNTGNWVTGSTNQYKNKKDFIPDMWNCSDFI